MGPAGAVRCGVGVDGLDDQFRTANWWWEGRCTASEGESWAWLDGSSALRLKCRLEDVTLAWFTRNQMLRSSTPASSQETKRSGATALPSRNQ